MQLIVIFNFAFEPELDSIKTIPLLLLIYHSPTNIGSKTTLIQPY